MKKVTSLKKFTLILSLGTLISYFGRLPFKFIALIVLSGSDYITFSLTIQTFSLAISVAGLGLHIPFTRELRLNSSEIIKVNFALSYLITEIFGFIFMSIMSFFFLTKLSLLQYLFLSITLALQASTEYFVAIVRSKGSALRSAIISSINGIIQGLIIIPFLFNFQNLLTLNLFIFIFCLGSIISFITGLILSNPNWKYFFIAMPNLSKKRNLKEAMSNIKNGSYLSFKGLVNSGRNWLLTFLAIMILTPNLFKIFDLCWYGISLITLFSGDLLVSTFSVSDTKKVSKRNKNLFYMVFIGIFMTFCTFFLIQLIPIEWFLNFFFNLDLSTEGRSIIGTAVFIPISIILKMFLIGKMQALGKYKELLIITLPALLVFIFFLIFGIFLNSVIILMIGLIIFNLIDISLCYNSLYIS